VILCYDYLSLQLQHLFLKLEEATLTPLKFAFKLRALSFIDIAEVVTLIFLGPPYRIEFFTRHPLPGWSDYYSTLGPTEASENAPYPWNLHLLRSPP